MNKKALKEGERLAKRQRKRERKLDRRKQKRETEAKLNHMLLNARLGE